MSGARPDRLPPSQNGDGACKCNRILSLLWGFFLANDGVRQSSALTKIEPTPPEHVDSVMRVVVARSAWGSLSLAWRR